MILDTLIPVPSTTSKSFGTVSYMFLNHTFDQARNDVTGFDGSL